MVLPNGCTILCMVLMICLSFINDTVSSFTILPSISTYISFGALTMISVMALSSSKGVMGPYPVISFCIKLKT